MKIQYKKIAKSLTGIQTPFFGVLWNPPETDREIVRKLIIFLEDRRALYNPYDIEMPEYVERSVLEIRKQLTELMGQLDANSDIYPHLQAMRAACRKSMDSTGKTNRFFRGGRGEMETFAALGEMRAIFGVHIGQLCVMYGIDIEEDLASILPLAAAEEDKEKPKRKTRGRS